MISEVVENLDQVRANIAAACARAGRAPADVALLAVSKKQPIERVRAAYQAGQRHFGENYVQELEARVAAFPGDAVWHLIGHLQTNKAKKAIVAGVIHTLDSERIARALAKAVEDDAAKRGNAVVPKDVLLEVNSGGEASKAGVEPEEAEALVEAVRALPALRLVGLMTIPPPGEGRPHFARLRALRDALRAKTGLALPQLSMGMSDDYEDAILEGATIVRVGTAIFGARHVGL